MRAHSMRLPPFTRRSAKGSIDRPKQRSGRHAAKPRREMTTIAFPTVLFFLTTRARGRAETHRGDLRRQSASLWHCRSSSGGRDVVDPAIRPQPPSTSMRLWRPAPGLWSIGRSSISVSAACASASISVTSCALRCGSRCGGRISDASARWRMSFTDIW